MKTNKIDFTVLPIAVRVYPDTRVTDETSGHSRKTWRRPNAMFVFDTETRTNATQTLIFGSYRFVVGGRCLEEGLFHADDVTEFERRILKTYVEAHRADTVREGKPDLRVLSVAQFVDRLYRAAYKGRCLLGRVHTI